ncbi:IS66 family insertion sequence element accessory protein TnpB [Mesorhizobium sp. M1409]|uniref:IS66 family insertion sequence element accessory protein TnpB n=1 Tax=unclassified Mesorhizobium TaxID=325217 RepID=UPI00333CB86E
MIAPGSGVRVYLATQPCDMRKGMDGLAAQVQNVLAADPSLCVGRDYVAEPP